MEPLTVLMPANLIPTHPRIDVLERALDSLELLQTSRPLDVLVCHDPPRPDASAEDRRRFARYLARLERSVVRTGRARMTVAPQWGHLTGSIRHALPEVHTEFMLVFQHDFFIVEPLPVDELIEMMRRHPQVRHLRFNRKPNLPRLWDGDGAQRAAFFAEVELDGQRLCRTLAWSDNPHLCRADYYRDVVLPMVGERQTFPEDVCNARSTTETHDLLGTFIYGGYGQERTIRHLDGATHTRPPLPRRILHAVRQRLRLRSRLRI